MTEKEIKICSVKGCGRNYHARGLCKKHSCDLWRKLNPNLSENRSWSMMKDRCYNDKNKRFVHYKGRGIIVCDRWKDSFENFLEDMGKKPSNKHQIDRINNDGNYEPSNCRWVTSEDNNRNKSTTKLSVEDVLYIRKSTESAKTLEEKFGVSRSLISKVRLKILWKNVE